MEYDVIVYVETMVLMVMWDERGGGNERIFR